MKKKNKSLVKIQAIPRSHTTYAGNPGWVVFSSNPPFGDEEIYLGKVDNLRDVSVHPYTQALLLPVIFNHHNQIRREYAVIV